MKSGARRVPRRPNMRRAVILFPSGFTLGNLFFGIFAIIAASRLQFTAASVYVLLGGICDALDGRVARATNAGTQFGEELDSLVDAISFGLAPAMIMYFAVLNREGWDWLLVFIFAACAVMRLARFNIEQAGTAKTYFRGLPSPAAGITLASYYWFSQSWLYNYGAIADLPWHVLLRFVMGGLAGLMISAVPYPAFPRTGFRSLRSIGASLLLVGSVALLFTRRLEYFFPLALIYVVWGLFRWVFFGLFERRQPTVPYDLSEGEDDDEEEVEEEFDLGDLEVPAERPEPRVSRAERGRGDRDKAADRPRPERGERPERGARPERPARAERPADTEREARREKKRERTKRGDRPDRPDRVTRPDRAEQPPRAAADPVVATQRADLADDIEPLAPFAASTLGAPDVELDDDLAPEDAAEGRSSAPASGVEGAPPRKRKRRRRRGERKERGEAILGTVEGDASTPAPGDSSAAEPSFTVSGDGSRDSAYREDTRPHVETPHPMAESPVRAAPPPEAPTPLSPPPRSEEPGE